MNVPPVSLRFFLPSEFVCLKFSARRLQSIIDALSDLQGDIRVLVATLKCCLKVLHHLQDDRIA